MSDKKFVVPDGMLKAGTIAGNAHYMGDREGVQAVLEAALRWLSENPPHPTEKQCLEMWRAADNHGDRYCQEWVRRMFLAEPEVPEAVNDLMWSEAAIDYEEHNEDVIEAYKRGKASK